MSTTVIHKSPAYEWAVSIKACGLGHHVRIESHVPIARRPERQVRFQSVLTAEELRVLHREIGKAIKGIDNREAAFVSPVPGRPRMPVRPFV